MVEILKTRQNSYENYSEGQDRLARGNRRGELVVCDFWTQLVLDGRMFHCQAGTEDAPVNTCTTIDDQLCQAVVDGTDGFTMIPSFADNQLATSANTAIPPISMLEIDRAKVRYAAGGGGSAFVPENLRTDRPRTSIATACRVGPDVIIAGKTTVPGSIELARRCSGETTASATNEPADFIFNSVPFFNARNGPMAVVVGVGSIVLYFGCATADSTGYSTLDWAELPTESVT